MNGTVNSNRIWTKDFFDICENNSNFGLYNLKGYTQMVKAAGLFMLIVLFCALETAAQVPAHIQAFRDDSLGNRQARHEAVFDGNLVRSRFYSNGEIGQWPYSLSGEWPKGSGHTYLDGFALLIGGELLAPGNNQIIHSIETSYREWMDMDPSGTVLWGLEPVPGYKNLASTKFAISAAPTTWPAKWPVALGLDSSWNGYWYGYFGKGIINADFESFFVMDDSKDAEFTRLPYRYYPVLSDSQRGGLGLRVQNRIMQWSVTALENVVFSLNDVFNISDFDYAKTCFGMYIDAGVGGSNDSQDDMASGDRQNDLVYMYDYDGRGVPNNWTTGYIGFSFLQTPSNSFNNIDDDGDGMIDERQDDGIDNDHDWILLTDDIGADGIRGTNDMGEGDGIPTWGEPNFDMTDIHESDQIGLNSLSIYGLGGGGTGGGWPKDDEPLWLKMSAGIFDTALQRSNISAVMASGPFPFNKWKAERFTTVLVFANSKDSLMLNKASAQVFFEHHFSFPTAVDKSEDFNVHDFDLYNNYPNPFNPSTEITYNLSSSGNVNLSIFDLNGNKIETLANGYQQAGKHSITFNAGKLASGTYFYTLNNGSRSLSKKMIVLK
ncbi:MAG: T9SS type A sorting domain-containing protein [Ignavibacteriales bacterium]|nr:T9SS type A sorting domain-containing protein [Ignavibacteriales bacterium]